MESEETSMSNPFLRLLPVYPLIAQQIVDDYQVTRGKCLDIGTGYGYLGIELAKITDLEMYFIDLDPEILEMTRKNATEGELPNKTHFVGADVCAIPFDDDFAELIVSRGSLWFWKDQVMALKEIYRVLKPGGVAFIGGGLGRYTPASMRKRLKGKRRQAVQERGEGRFLNGEELRHLLSKTGISEYRIVHDTEDGDSEESGTWIEIRKSL